MDYRDIEKVSWYEAEKAAVHNGIKPHSVHFPLNKPYQDHLIFCDSAFNVYRLEVPPDMKSSSITCAQIRDDIKMPLVSFAFDDPAFIPEFRQSVWERIGGRYPMAHGRLYATTMQYDLEYALDPESNLVYVRVTVTNNDEIPRQAVVRCLQSRPRERAVMDYHYYPFRWDISRWAELVRDEELQPLVAENGGFEVDENNSFSFESSEYNQRFRCGQPYVANPYMQLKQGSGLMRFARELAAGESASFTLAISFEDGKLPVKADFETVCRKNREFWDSLTPACELFFADRKSSDQFYALQWNSLQLLLMLDSPTLGRVCQPSQGGSSERFYVWVWEAMCSLRPMLKLGYGEPVKKVLDFIFKLQDGGTPPVGEFSSLAGAIGTTGPRWANATGSALLLATDYALLAGDSDFLPEYLPKMMRAARWILGEVKATRRYNPDGSKQFGFGVMPFACATDGDKGFIIASTDSWSFAGVESFAGLLKVTGHPEYAEIAAEVELYRRDLSAAIDSVRREDGFIDRKLSDAGKIARVFNKSSGSLRFLESGFAQPDEERFAGLIKYFEEHVFEERFCSPLLDGIYYIGNGEQNMFQVYCKMHQWKKAHLAAETFCQCGMTQDLYLTQERYSPLDAAFIPWQPNASNNGRYINMMLRRLYLEDGKGGFILLGGVTPAVADKEFLLKGLRTPEGEVEIRCCGGRLTLKRTRAFPAGCRFTIPDHFGVSGENLKPAGNGVFELIAEAREIRAAIKLK